MAKPPKLNLELESFIDTFRVKTSQKKNAFFRKPEKLRVDENPHAQKIEDFLDSTKQKIENTISNANKQNIQGNISLTEWKSIQSLKTNTNIIIKSADKGAGVVLQDRTKYLEEAMRILNDQANYREIPTSLQQKHANTYNRILSRMLTSGEITRRKCEELKPPKEGKYSERIIYFLPKIHKERSKWKAGNPPGRPIVSNCGTEGSAISKLLEKIIQERINENNVPCVVKNSYEFMKTFKKVRSEYRLLPKNIEGKYRTDNLIFIQGDVKELYPSIPPEQALTSLIQCLNTDSRTKQNETLKKISIRSIVELIKPQLFENDFTLNGKFFQQIRGIAMGQAWAPALANLFLRHLDTVIMSYKPKIYKRYIDDLILLWDKGRPALENMKKQVAEWNPKIEIEWEEPGQTATFLDMKFTIENHQLESQIFFKPTDSRRLLDSQSYHPPHTSRGVIKSQILRYRRLCTRKRDAMKATHSLFNILKDQGFSNKILSKIEKEVFEDQNPDSLKPKRPPTVPLIATWDQRMKPILQTLRKDFADFRKENPAMQDSLPAQIQISWRSHKNLRNLTIRSKLPPISI